MLATGGRSELGGQNELPVKNYPLFSRIVELLEVYQCAAGGEETVYL